MRNYDIGSIVTIESAQIIKSLGAAVIVTDGKYIQIVKESDKGNAK